jgi:hypothetical protein
MQRHSSTDVRNAQERLAKAVRERDVWHLYELGRELKRKGGRQLMRKAFAVLNNRKDRVRVFCAWSDFLTKWVEP